MKIWFISDTHGLHDRLEIPEADMVVHCGDESNSRNPHQNHTEAIRFFQWYRSLPIKDKIYVPGNHSTAVWSKFITQADYPDICFLIHKEIRVAGLKIFGSPYTPRFGDWAFMEKRNKMAAVWENIPACDILVTHGPPKGILDLAEDTDNGSIVQVGCKSLLNAVNRIVPRVHAFGHIHDDETFLNYGIFALGETTFINCACLNHRKMSIHNGHVIEI